MARLNGLVVLLILLFPTNNIYANDIGQFIWGGETGNKPPSEFDQLVFSHSLLQRNIRLGIPTIITTG